MKSLKIVSRRIIRNAYKTTNYSLRVHNFSRKHLTASTNRVTPLLNVDVVALSSLSKLSRFKGTSIMEAFSFHPGNGGCCCPHSSWLDFKSFRVGSTSEKVRRLRSDEQKVEIEDFGLTRDVQRVGEGFSGQWSMMRNLTCLLSLIVKH